MEERIKTESLQLLINLEKVCLRYMNRFNSLKHMQQLDAHKFNQKKRKNRKKKIFSLQLSEFMLQ